MRRSDSTETQLINAIALCVNSTDQQTQVEFNDVE